MFSGHFKAATANLRAARWRSALTMLGIIIGVSSVITVVSLGEGLKNQVVGQVNQLGSNVLTIRPGKLVSGGGDNQNLNLLALLSASTLSDKDIGSLDKLSSLQSVVPVNFVTSGVLSDQTQLDNISVIGTRPDLARMLGLNTRLGDFLTDQNTNDHVAVIGSDVADKLFSVINPIGHTIDIAGQSFAVQAVLEPASTGLLAAAQTDFNSAVLIPYQPSKALTHGQTNLLQILVQAGNGISIDQASQGTRQTLLNNHDGLENFTILKQYQLLRLVNGVINNATGFIAAIAAISLLVGGIGIMDIMLASVAERTREIGIRKAIGASNRQILAQFFTEGLILSLVGGLLGIVLALLATQALKFYTSLHPLINVPVVILAVAISVLLGIIFSIVPALKAARKHPIDALRA